MNQVITDDGLAKGGGKHLDQLPASRLGTRADKRALPYAGLDFDGGGLAQVGASIGADAAGAVISRQAAMSTVDDSTRYDTTPDAALAAVSAHDGPVDRKSTRLNSSHSQISYAVFCLK